MSGAKLDAKALKTIERNAKKAAAAARKSRVQLLEKAFGDRVSGTFSKSLIYNEDGDSMKVAVMTGKWELKPETIKSGELRNIIKTPYGILYETNLVGADKLRDNIRGTEIFNHDGSLDVIVKRVAECDGAAKADIGNFTKEASALKDLRHPNVLMLYGFMTHFEEDGVAMSMVFEQPGQGNLKVFLDKRREEGLPPSLIYDSAPDGVLPVSTASKISMAFDIAKGMEYLICDQRVSLCEMAAHLCVLSNDGVVRIGDWGQGRIDFPDYYSPLDGAPKGQTFPVRWMAPEAVKDYTECGSAPAAWSYGVTVWEIAMLGADPYDGMAPAALRKYILAFNHPQLQKFDMPENVIKLLEKCFDADPDERPSFPDIKISLENIIAGQQEAVNKHADIYRAGFHTNIKREGESTYRLPQDAIKPEPHYGNTSVDTIKSNGSNGSNDSEMYGAVLSSPQQSTGAPAASPRPSLQFIAPLKPEEPDYEYQETVAVLASPATNEEPPPTTPRNYAEPIAIADDDVYEAPVPDSTYEVPVGTLRPEEHMSDDYEVPVVAAAYGAVPADQTYDDLESRPAVADAPSRVQPVQNPTELPGMRFNRQNEEYEKERQRRLNKLAGKPSPTKLASYNSAELASASASFAATSTLNEPDLFDKSVPKLADANDALAPQKSDDPLDEAEMAAALEGLGKLYTDDVEAPKNSAPPVTAAALEAHVETIAGMPEDQKLTDNLTRYKEVMRARPKYYKVGRFKSGPPAAKLRAACKKGYYEVVAEVLNDTKLEIDGARSGGSGRTALHHAAGKGFLRIVKMLLDAGANPYVADTFGYFPLDYATKEGRQKVAKAIKTTMLKGGAAALGELYEPEEGEEIPAKEGSKTLAEGSQTAGDAQ